MDITPSKLRSERITLTYNFLPYMEWAETITTFNAYVTVRHGEDANPNHILFGDPSLLSPVLSQQIHLGEPGVIYQVHLEVDTSNGQKLAAVLDVAVLPSVEIRPPPYAVYYTTGPYPYVWDDTFSVSTELTQGFIYPAIRDDLFVGTAIMSGVIRAPLFNYNWEGENFSTTTDILSGSVRNPLVTYAWPIEPLYVGSLIISGSIVVMLIRYTNWPAEPLYVSSDIVSGVIA